MNKLSAVVTAIIVACASQSTHSKDDPRQKQIPVVTDFVAIDLDSGVCYEIKEVKDEKQWKSLLETRKFVDSKIIEKDATNPAAWPKPLAVMNGKVPSFWILDRHGKTQYIPISVPLPTKPFYAALVAGDTNTVSMPPPAKPK